MCIRDRCPGDQYHGADRPHAFPVHRCLGEWSAIRRHPGGGECVARFWAARRHLRLDPCSRDLNACRAKLGVEPPAVEHASLRAAGYCDRTLQKLRRARVTHLGSHMSSLTRTSA